MKYSFLGRALFWFLSFTLPFLVLLAFQVTPPAKPSEKAIWWEIKLELKTQGKYRLEDSPALYSGNYLLTFLWRGSTERDNGDYILYHYSNELLQWQAEETANLPTFIKILTTPDFMERPSFKINYILKKEDHLYFDFTVNSFFVPVNASLENFYLHLPSSKENFQLISDINYNFFVRKGSNQVAVKESEIYRGPVEKNFNWTWKYQQWLDKGNRIIFISNGHEVKARLTIIPHQARG